jgi:hypothetical protein
MKTTEKDLLRLAPTLLLLAALLISSCAAPRRTGSIPFQIGTTTVHAHVFQHHHPGPTYLNVHDDENTSVRAGKKCSRANRRTLIELVHSGQRHVASNSTARPIASIRTASFRPSAFARHWNAPRIIPTAQQRHRSFHAQA